MNNLASALKHELCNEEDVCSEKSAVKGLQKKRRGQSTGDLFGNCSTSLGRRPEATSTLSPVCDQGRQLVPGRPTAASAPVWNGPQPKEVPEAHVASPL